MSQNFDGEEFGWVYALGKLSALPIYVCIQDIIYHICVHSKYVYKLYVAFISDILYDSYQSF